MLGMTAWLMVPKDDGRNWLTMDFQGRWLVVWNSSSHPFQREPFTKMIDGQHLISNCYCLVDRKSLLTANRYLPTGSTEVFLNTRHLCPSRFVGMTRSAVWTFQCCFIQLEYFVKNSHVETTTFYERHSNYLRWCLLLRAPLQFVF
jgi:hypothetical protein